MEATQEIKKKNLTISQHGTRHIKCLIPDSLFNEISDEAGLI